MQAAQAAVEHATTHAVSGAVTAMFALLLVVMIACLALEEKLHAKKSLIVGVIAVIALILATAFALEPFGAVTLPNGHQIEMPVYIPTVDWGVIAIILGSSIFVDVTSRSGLFSWIAIKLTKASRGEPLLLLWYYGVMTVIFSAVLNNVTAMIIVGSLTVVSLDKLNKNDKLLGFLLVEGLLTNIGGLLTLISSVPNIIVGNTAGISFAAFVLKASPYVVIATIATLLLGAAIFKIKKISGHSERSQAAELVASFDENDGIESRSFFRFSSIMLLLFILTIATASILPIIRELGLGFVALAFAVVMLIRYKAEVDQFYKALDWDLVFFFIGVLEHALVLEWIGKGIAWLIGSEESSSGISLLLVVSAVFSSVTDNIPLAAMLAKILAAAGTAGDSSLWWAVIFGANLGGNLTPIGSASKLVAVTIMLKHQLPISFASFVIKALPFAIMHIVLGLVYVLLSA